MNTLNWYIDRLRVMSPQEVVYRARQKLSAAALSLGGIPSYLRTFNIPDHRTVAFEIEDPPPDLVDEISQTLAEIAAQAKGPRRNCFSLLGLPEMDFGTPLNWFLDPITGKEWPRNKPASSINYRHQEELGEVKYVWEVGRMPWLLPRAIAARLLHDEELARYVIEDIAHFARSNPPYMGIHWTSGLEHAVRIVNWTWALALISPIVTPTESDCEAIARYVATAADFCYRFPSLYSSANNHLIGEAAAMEIAGRSWPFLPHAKRLASRGTTIIDREFPRQVTPDGFCVELSPAYLLEDVEWSLCVAAVRRQYSQNFPAIWSQRWRAVAQFIMALTNGQSDLPAIADSDDANILFRPVPLKTSDWISLLSLAGNERVVEQSLSTTCRVAAWLWKLPPRISDSRNEVSVPVPRAKKITEQKAHIFLPSGIIVLRGPMSRLIADFGPHGFPPLHAHAHADSLSVVVYGGDEPILVDPGTYCYHGQKKWRNWFRSTRAHNTMEINGKNQSEIRGAFLWGKVATTRLESWSFGPRSVCQASHDGYSPLRHTRNISSSHDDIYLIVDRVAYEGAKSERETPTCILWWHFAPGKIAIEDNSVRWMGTHVQCVLTWQSSWKPYDVLHYEGDDEIPQGWVSPHFSVKEPAPVIGLCFRECELPFACTTTLHILPKV
jgi:hypothetical protein